MTNENADPVSWKTATLTADQVIGLPTLEKLKERMPKELKVNTSLWGCKILFDLTIWSNVPTSGY